MKRNGRTLAAVFLVGALIAGVLPVAAQEAGAFKVGAAPPPQEVYTKVNLTEPYDIIEGFTIYPSLRAPTCSITFRSPAWRGPSRDGSSSAC
jgi:hypothetical protein